VGMKKKLQENGSVTGSNFIRELISGSMLTDRIILKNLWFLILLTILGALYIANRFHAEKIVREMTRLQKEVRELRAESLATSAALMEASRQSEVVRQASQKELGLEELKEPPYKLVKRR